MVGLYLLHPVSADDRHTTWPGAVAEEASAVAGKDGAGHYSRSTSLTSVESTRLARFRAAEQPVKSACDFLYPELKTHRKALTLTMSRW